MLRRYTPTVKAKIVRQLATGAKTRTEIMVEHRLSDEELAEWIRDDKLGTGAHRRAGGCAGGYAYSERRRRKLQETKT